MTAANGAPIPTVIPRSEATSPIQVGKTKTTKKKTTPILNQRFLRNSGQVSIF